MDGMKIGLARSCCDGSGERHTRGVPVRPSSRIPKATSIYLHSQR